MMKQQTKVWAMHDGPNCPDWCEPNKWFEVEETQSGRCFRAAGGIFVWGGLPFQRHVGPTPPDTQETALQQLADMGQAFDAAPDADGWKDHDGSAKRPKGVGKRDEGEFWYIGGAIQKWQARFVNWQHIHSYRITKRAEKRRKVWLQGGDGMALDVCENKTHAFKQKAKLGGKVYTAKLTEVTE